MSKDQLDDEGISLADNEEILHALSELTPVYENDRSYFVLGNYLASASESRRSRRA